MATLILNKNETKFWRKERAKDAFNALCLNPRATFHLLTFIYLTKLEKKCIPFLCMWRDGETNWITYRFTEGFPVMC